MPRVLLTSIAFACALFLPPVPGASASPESDRLLADGLEKLKAGEFAEAESLFAQAVRAEPGDRRIAFLRGFTLNRMGQHTAALESLQHAAAAGLRAPPLDYEIGWAAVATGDWPRAVESLERYEAARPGNAKASELLGRAYLALGRFDEAEAKLREAITRDPAVRDTAMLSLAQVQARRGALDDSLTTLERVTRTAPGSQIGVAAREAMSAVAEERLRRKPWDAYVGVALGKNSNVINFGEDVVEPADLSRKDSRFARLNAGASYTERLSTRDLFTLGYNGQYDHYTQIDDQDIFNNGLFATLRHGFSQEVTGSLAVSGQHAYLDGDRYVSGIGVQPSLLWGATDWLQLEPYVGWAYADYRPPITASDFLDRDSRTRSAGLNAYLAIPGTPVQLVAGAALVTNDADGSDYDYHARRFRGGAAAALPWDVTATLDYTRTLYEYDHLHSLSPTGGFVFARSDRTTTIRARLSRPIIDRLVGYVEYDELDNHSNLAVFRFDQWSALFGLVYRF